MCYINAGFDAAVKGAPYPITLYKLTGECGGSYGAAILGAKAAGLNLKTDYDKNRTVFYSTRN